MFWRTRNYHSTPNESNMEYRARKPGERDRKHEADTQRGGGKPAKSRGDKTSEADGEGLILKIWARQVAYNRIAGENRASSGACVQESLAEGPCGVTQIRLPPKVVL